MPPGVGDRLVGPAGADGAGGVAGRPGVPAGDDGSGEPGNPGVPLPERIQRPTADRDCDIQPTARAIPEPTPVELAIDATAPTALAASGATVEAGRKLATRSAEPIGRRMGAAGVALAETTHVAKD